MSGIEYGFEITPTCLSGHECDRLSTALSTPTISRSRAGARHLMSNSVIRSLALDDRLTELAKKWIGPVAIPYRATLFEKSGATNWLIPWHQDTALPLSSRREAAGWGPWSQKAGATYAHAPANALSRVIALRVHVDASEADNGPLRVIPGSHSRGVLSDRDVMEYVVTSHEVECHSPRGGIIAMRPLLIHSSSKARSTEPRRVLHIEYADCLDIGDGMRLAIV
jgi:ectoine hydroxylase-related dioxygenase (phytanoyl-CoA dioxygenase family)